MIRRLVALAVLPAFLSTWTPAAAFELVDVDLPANTTLTMISDSLVQNGLPLSLATLEGDRSNPEIAAWFAGRWEAESREGTVEFRDFRLGDERVLARFDGRFNLVFQFDAVSADAAPGLLSLSDTQAAGDAAEVELPAGFERLSTTIADDPLGHSMTVLLQSNATVAETARRYLDWLDAMHWTRTSSHSINGVHHSEHRRRRERQTLLIHRGVDGATQIVVNINEKNR